jgi:polyribonucleotide nucleotidyltransferase
VVTVMSLDPQDPYDALAINAASASTQLSGLPFSGPIGAVRVALIDGRWIAFPQHEDLQRAVFDMVVAGRTVGDDVAIMMVEAEATTETNDLVAAGAQAPTEEIVAAGLEAAKPFIRTLCVAQQQLADLAAKPTGSFPTFPAFQDDVFEAVSATAADDLAQALAIAGKQDRESRLDQLKATVLEKVGPQFEGREKEIGAAFRSLNKKLVRQRILRDKVRIDGRGLTDIRPLSAEVEVVPRAHGSALFERGETQIMGVTTLNMLRMEQQIDSLGPESHKRYLHHYNFPPYSTGETGRVGSPSAARSATARSPSGRCCRAAHPRGVPVRDPPGLRGARLERLDLDGRGLRVHDVAAQRRCPAEGPVAGIAMGLVSDQVDGQTTYVGADRHPRAPRTRSVTWTSRSPAPRSSSPRCSWTPSSTASRPRCWPPALSQAKDARLTILEVIGEAIDRPDEMSRYAPRVVAIKVPVDKIGEVIGPKGKMINSITEQTGADISIEDDGTIYVGATDGDSAEAAIGMINAIANPQLPKIGERFLGTVVKTAAFGAFVSLVPGKDGLVHISKLGSGKRIAKVEDVVKVGDKLRVEVTDIDNRGKISLVPVQDGDSAGEPAPAGEPAESPAASPAEVPAS